MALPSRVPKSCHICLGFQPQVTCAPRRGRWSGELYRSRQAWPWPQRGLQGLAKVQVRGGPRPSSQGAPLNLLFRLGGPKGTGSCGATKSMKEVVDVLLPPGWAPRGTRAWTELGRQTQVLVPALSGCQVTPYLTAKTLPENLRNSSEVSFLWRKDIHRMHYSEDVRAVVWAYSSNYWKTETGG